MLAPDFPRGAALGRILGVIAGLLVMAIGMPYLGFAVTGAITMIILLRTVEQTSWVASVGLALVSVRVVVWLFGHVLGHGAAARTVGLLERWMRSAVSLTGFSVILTPANLYLCFLGSLIGTLVGVLPGVGPLAALALLLPVTFTLSPVGGMVMLASIFYGAMYGGSTTSILLNIPGEAASVVTCIDGHQMARQGRAGPALGIAAIGSFIAGTLGVVVMTFFAPADRRGRHPLRAAGEFRA